MIDELDCLCVPDLYIGLLFKQPCRRRTFVPALCRKLQMEAGDPWVPDLFRRTQHLGMKPYGKQPL